IKVQDASKECCSQLTKLAKIPLRRIVSDCYCKVLLCGSFLGLGQKPHESTEAADPQHYNSKTQRTLQTLKLFYPVSVSLGELSPARMRILSALLVVVLLCFLQQVCSDNAVQDAAKECCSKVTKVAKIPLRRIVSYWRTHSNCPLPAVVSVSLGELSPARMRILSALLVVVLLCSLQQVCSGTAGNEASKECCPKLTTMKIPLNRIVSYSWTRTDCALQAV
ncbi:hypothetical protein NFI96_027637, partial [Prochilodus magdalenae]